MGAAEPAQRQRQPALGEIRRQAEAHGIFDRATAQGDDRLFIEIEDAPGIGQHDIARLGRHQPPRRGRTNFVTKLLSNADFSPNRRLAA
jgi:hypothetical protein